VTFPLILMMLLAGPAPQPAVGPALSTHEATAKRLERELIAPCCWSQQVSLHTSGAADAMRREIREMLARGASRQEVLDAYVAQYGTRILAVPPNRGFSSLLHAWPWVAGLGSVLLLAGVLRAVTGPRTRRAELAGTPQLSQDDQDRLDAELREVD
jgi:cytochrome c-type biogenesis protein CcmH